MATVHHIDTDRKFWEDKAFIPIAALGVGAIMFALAFAVGVGLYVGDLFPGPHPSPEQAEGVVESFDKWGRLVAFLGASLLMTAVVVVLRRIIKTIRFVRGEAMRVHLPTLLSPRGGN